MIDVALEILIIIGIATLIICYKLTDSILATIIYAIYIALIITTFYTFLSVLIN